MDAVLVLNATYEPLNVVSVRRAVVLILKEKAELLEATQAQLRAEHFAMDVPLVIRLVRYVRIPRRLTLPLSRRTVLARDHYTCQYCGVQASKSSLTVDHVLPRWRGGKNTWDNVVTACVSCNQRKGGRTPVEAGLRLRSKPQQPRYVAIALLGIAPNKTAWSKYFSE
ncbi:MAG: HNH endonuclease [Chloroflexi bacterium]|nr:HNH endonuclease [Chloroflexota bacterium]